MKFPRIRRITRRSDFQRVRTQGRSLHGQFLVLGYLRDGAEENDTPSRLGLITTKRLGNAVVRNRVRRKLRGIMQRIGDRFAPGFLLVLIARNAASGASSEQLEKEWKWLMHRASLVLLKED